MTSRERMMAAWRSQPVDHVPFGVHFWPTPRHPHAIWSTERERLAFYRNREWDARLEVGTWISPLPDVQVEVRYEGDGVEQVLHQRWQTPTGTLSERLRVTDDWPGQRDATNPVGLGDDFRTSRYLEFPFKAEEDGRRARMLKSRPRVIRLRRQPRPAGTVADDQQLPGTARDEVQEATRR